MRTRSKRSIGAKTILGPDENKVFTLANALPDKKYRIVNIDGGCKINSKLCAMGLMPDEVVSVYIASRGGPVCIAVKGSKFAIGRGMTNRIIIEEI